MEGRSDKSYNGNVKSDLKCIFDESNLRDFLSVFQASRLFSLILEEKRLSLEASSAHTAITRGSCICWHHTHTVPFPCQLIKGKYVAYVFF